MVTELRTVHRYLYDEEQERVARLHRQVGWTPGLTAEQLHRRIAPDGVIYGINATRRRLCELQDDGRVEERDGLWFVVGGVR